MKKLRIILIALAVMLVTMFVLSTNMVQAATRTLNRQDERPYSNDNYDDDEIVGNDFYQINRSGTLYRFVKIYDANKSEADRFTNFIYCLRGGVGFGNVTNGGTTDNVEYSEIGEMHEDVDTIINTYVSWYTGDRKISKEDTVPFEVYTTDENGQPKKETKNVNLYNAILWIADNAYLPPLSNTNTGYNAEVYKNQLLDRIGVAKVNRDLITDDDIEAVQQLAFWYFANYDEQESGEVTSLSIASKLPFSGSNAIKLGNKNDSQYSKTIADISSIRAVYLDRLYNYFIDGAIQNAEEYGTGSTRNITKPSLSFDKTVKFEFKEKSGNLANEHQIVGPFKIIGTGINGKTTINIKDLYLTDKNGNGIDMFNYLDEEHSQATQVYYIVTKENGSYKVVEEDTLNIGQEYYISLATYFDKSTSGRVSGKYVNGRELYDFSEITVGLSTSYIKSTAKFLAPQSTNDQALVELEKTVIPIDDKITTVKPGNFSLNLTKVKSGTNQKLAGAKFKLVPGTWNAETKTFTPSGTETEFGPTESTERSVLSLIENQEFTEAGTYYFKITESATPNGYFTLENPIIIKIEVTKTDTGFSVNAKLLDKEGNEVTEITGVAKISIDNTTNTISLMVENKEQKFDLALRKYIISANGNTLEGSNSRVPNIDPTPLNNPEGGTAEYKHKKDAVEVTPGSEVIYRIETYNEGNVDGYVYTIEDYLPDYLEFVPTSDFISKADYDALTQETAGSVTAKYVYEFNSSTKVLTVWVYTNPWVKGGLTPTLWKLNAYDGETLDKNHIDLKFKVKDNFAPRNDTYLTNVATMTYSSETMPLGGTIIPGETSLIDRDSNRTGVEFNIPDQSKLVSENETEYKGNTINKDILTDKDYHYTGQQDDDDFEKLVVRGIKFDLSLRKFITKIGEQDVVPSRVPQIDISPLEDNNPETTTANYIHPKNTLSLKRGDEITYTLRVYNEGNVDGTVTEITDYLPEGLEFYPEGLGLVETEDSTYALKKWQKTETETTGNSVKTTVTTYTLNTSTNELKITRQNMYGFNDGTIGITAPDDVLAYLPKYDSTKTSASSGENWQKAYKTAESKELTGLYYADVQVVCKIKDTVTDNAILKNVAEITGATGGTDIDSTVDNVYDDNEHKPGNETNGYTPGEEDDDDFEKVTVEPEAFDLALRKYITGLTDKEGITKGIKDVQGSDGTRSLSNVDVTPLKTGSTTANYKHRKDPVVVETGDIVTYTLRVYNEGDIDGYVTEIKDILPEGVEFISPTTTINTDFVIEGQTSETAKYTYSVQDGVLTIKPISGKEDGTVFKKLTKFDSTGTTLDYGEISFKCKVTAKVGSTDKVLTNVARITADRADIEGDKNDRDSQPETFITPQNLPNYRGLTSEDKSLSDNNTYYPGQQDDDDFEKLIVLGKPFDLSLRKFITKVNGEEVKDENNKTREPGLDMQGLEDGSKTTARYEHPKDELVVKQGDIVTYKIRVYNEGARNGYATEVTDYLPEGLGFIVGYGTNVDNNWGLEEGTSATKLSDLKDVYEKAKTKLQLSDFAETEKPASIEDVQIVTGKTKITSSLLNNKLLNAYDKTITSAPEGKNWQKAMDGKGTTGLYYEDIEVTCIVLAPNTYKGVLKNIAAITGAKDENDVIIKNVGDDRDSEPDQINVESYHKSQEDKGYFPGEQDDDDFEPIILQYFDLALRKFITGVNKTEVTSRVPVLSIDPATGNIKYTHPKEEAPVEVETNNEVTYTLRIFNEGTKAGYADLVADDIPEGLLFLPENSTNKEYRWVMYKEVPAGESSEDEITIDGKRYIETKNAEEADMIQTDYLSKEQGEKRMKEGDTQNPALLSAFDNTKALSGENPDYADIKVVFKVLEPNTSDRVIVNSAQITHDTDDKGKEVDDEDSETNKWNDGEDDQDKEYIKVKYFDLSLYKWVTKTIVTVDGTTTTTETGFTPNIGKTINVPGMNVRENSEDEPIAGVVLNKKKLNSTTVKFAYSIMVMNEGEIAGSATEITDYIPEGLEFYEEDNTAFGWEYAGDGKITTRCLDGLVLQPGEYATVDVVFTWINDAENLGLKTNIAEISEDFNESGSKDIDSTPNNKYDEYLEEQEDDDDFALVILQLETGGKAVAYIALTTAVLAILAGGTILIKKYVL